MSPGLEGAAFALRHNMEVALRAGAEDAAQARGAELEGAGEALGFRDERIDVHIGEQQDEDRGAARTQQGQQAEPAHGERADAQDERVEGD